MRLLFLVFIVLFSFKTYAQGSLEGDRLALVALYNATNGDSWVSTESVPWPVDDILATNPCGWYGVTCVKNRVSELNLPLNDLYGSLPPEIGNLYELKRLNLKGVGSREYGVALEGNTNYEIKSRIFSNELR